MRALLLFALVFTSCSSPKYYRVPRTEEGVWCLGYCAKDYVRCMDGTNRSSQLGSCMKWRNQCLAGCPGAVEVSQAEYETEPDGG